ncbi:MAG: hypothetical protein AAFZ09_21080, partial [Pseudomonadota bacterium]
LVALEASRRRNERQRSDRQPSDPRSSEPRRGPRWLLVLAAVAAAVVLTLQLDRGGPPPAVDDGPKIFLGPELDGAAPAGPSEAYTPFEWSYDAPPGTTFEIRVYDAESDRLLAESGRLRSAGWSPADTATWPDQIRWTLEVRKGDTVLERWSVASWRRSP